MATTLTAPRFPLGHCQATPAARDLLAEAGVSARTLLARHVVGDWGEVPAEDAVENEFSVGHGFRIISNYAVGTERVWIITEAVRSVTTILLPEEY